MDLSRLHQLDSWIKISEFLSDSNCLSTQYICNGKKVKVNRIEKTLDEIEFDSYDIEGGGLKIRHGMVSSHKYVFIKIINVEGFYLNWDDLILSISEEGDFILGFLEDVKYSYWQNAEDLLLYESENKSHDHLPKKPNGLPYPLEAEIVDISNNPGRRVHRNGYLEGVGATMWLGEHFWGLTGARKEEILASETLKIQKLKSILKIRAQEHNFTKDSGEELEKQKLLWNLLFPGRSSEGQAVHITHK